MICWPRDVPSPSSPVEDEERVRHDYHDHANDNDFMNASLLTGGLSYEHIFPHLASGRGNEQPFPVKLHCMLETVEKDGLTSIISWQPHGRCFLVHSQDEFVDKYLKSWFRQTKFPSFQRQLNLYGFKRITAGQDKGGYYHELFLRSRRFLSYRIHRLKIKGTGVRKPAAPEAEPNFYKIPFLPPTFFKQDEDSASNDISSGVPETKPDAFNKAQMETASLLMSAAVGKNVNNFNPLDSESDNQTCVLPVPLPPASSWFVAPPNAASSRTHSVIGLTTTQPNTMVNALEPQKFSIVGFKDECTQSLLPNVPSPGQNPGSLLDLCWPPNAKSSGEEMRQQFVRFCAQTLEMGNNTMHIDSRRGVAQEARRVEPISHHTMENSSKGDGCNEIQGFRAKSPDLFTDQQDDDDTLPCDTEFEEMVHSLMRMPPSNANKR